MNNALLMLYVKTDCALKRMVDRLHQDRRGAGVAEYAMIIGIAVVLGVILLRKFWGNSDEEGLRHIFKIMIQKLTDAVSANG